eukprot:Phypoly_transcript_03126.p1 GENE.Phypoly_transcript_03126~~Phypoly_transcript_03126.p1  ORF type:complete len:604 (+),score=35.02 Phypoly_transcript_03126:39-1814(+)
MESFLLLIIFSFPISLCLDIQTSCNELYPVTSFPSPYFPPNSPSPTKTIHWPMGYISSCNLSTCSRFSMMRFAAEYIYNYTTLIPQVALDFVASDINGSRTNGLLASVTQIRVYNIKSVMGAATDEEADATAFLANEFELAQVSTIQSQIYSNVDRYPYFMRTIPAFNYQRAVVKSIMDYFNWTKAILVTTDDSYGNDADDYVTSLATYKIFPIKISIECTEFTSQIGNISELMDNFKVVLMFTTFKTGILFMQQLNEAGLINGDLQYILSQTMTQSIMYGAGNIAKYDDLLDGAIGMLPYGAEGPMFTEVSDLWMASDPKRFPGLRPASPLMWYSFETIYLQAIALHNLLEAGYDVTKLSAEDYYRYLVNTSYEGVTGQVTFDSMGDRIGNWKIINFVESNLTSLLERSREMYRFSAKFIGTTNQLTNITRFTFFGGSTHPLIESIADKQFKGMTAYYRTFGVAISVCTAFSICSIFILIWKWSSFQRQGPYYCLIINIGTLFCFGSAAMLLWPPTPMLCMFFPWLIAIGFGLVYGCLFIKTWTIYMVFRRASKFQFVRLSPFYIIKILAIFMCVDVVSRNFISFHFIFC